MIKDKKCRFLKTGKLVAIFLGDSYLIKRSNGKLQKKRHYDFKELRAANEFTHVRNENKMSDYTSWEGMLQIYFLHPFHVNVH